MFKRQGVYYSMFGHCCCFCAAGSDIGERPSCMHAYIACNGCMLACIGVYTASSPLGPWTTQQDIGCQVPAAAVLWQQPEVQACASAAELRGGGGYNVGVARAVESMRTDPCMLSNGVEYLWTGDRWQSAPDKIKDHDFQYAVGLNSSWQQLPTGVASAGTGRRWRGALARMASPCRSSYTTWTTSPSACLESASDHCLEHVCRQPVCLEHVCRQPVCLDIWFGDKIGREAVATCSL